MSRRRTIAARWRAVLAALARSQAIAAAGTALYRNQQIPQLPRRGAVAPRAWHVRDPAHAAFPVAPLCPVLPMR